MSTPVDPPRLVDPGSSASPRLRELLEQSRADLGTPAELQVLEAALLPTFTASVAAKASLSLLAKAAIVAAVSASAVAAYIAVRPAAPSPGVAREPSKTAPVAAVPVTEPVAAPSPAVPPAQIVAPPGEKGAIRPATPNRNAPVAVTGSEAELLNEAQAALARDPSRALALAEQHVRQFPGGLLGQEREVIAVEALARLGRKAAADARGERFLAAHPKSAYREKIQSILGRQ